MSLPDSKSADGRPVVERKSGANVYTALLALSLIALAIGIACLAAELNAYNWSTTAR